MTPDPSHISKIVTSLAGGLLGAGLLLAMTVSLAMAGPDRWKRDGWKTDFGKTSIDFGEVLSGGPPKDGIPSIDRPKFIPVAKEKELGAKEPVIGLIIKGDARAYPLRILIWHEIANDIVGGVPVAVTYCPLCNSAIAFRRTVRGKVLDFGTTGKLRNSDLVMYDRQTESWWQQFTGQGIVGAYTGVDLEMIPARLESFERFRAAHPQGKVLVPNNAALRAYGRNPYEGYDRRDRPYPLYTGGLPDNINPMARVIAIKSGGKAKAVTLSLLRKKKSLRLGDVMLTWTAGQNSALDTSRIDKARDVGNVVARRKSGDSETDAVYDVTFAFVFHAFHPDSPIRQN